MLGRLNAAWPALATSPALSSLGEKPRAAVGYARRIPDTDGLSPVVDAKSGYKQFSVLIVGRIGVHQA